MLFFLGTTAHPTDITFEKGKITLGGKTILVEIAKNHTQYERGLMFRKNLPENEGMLFIFDEEEIRYFWMKNTYIDLSIGYFDKKMGLVDIQEMKAPSVLESRPPSYPSAKPAMYALEMKKGWFTKNKIKIGQKLRISSR
ncbi:MAG TPA: DUF192 domain-containing protein [Pseudobdellovibrionaceae bacterium]